METPQEFAERWLRNGMGGWNKLFLYIAIACVTVGTVIAFYEFWDEPRQLVVPLLLAGLAFLLFRFLPCVEGILVDLEYMAEIEKEKREKIQD